MKKLLRATVKQSLFEIASGYRPRNGNMKKQRPSKEVKKP